MELYWHWLFCEWRIGHFSLGTQSKEAGNYNIRKAFKSASKNIWTEKQCGATENAYDT